MGDVMEFSTLTPQKNIFHRITSSAVTFEVKGDSYAAIGLARSPKEKYIIWIVLLHKQITIEINKKTCHIARGASYFLSEIHFRRFWISWHNNRLSFGQYGEVQPLIAKRLNTQDIEYITFSLHPDKDYTARKLEWKLFIPPNIERPVLKDIANGDLHWVNSGKKIPDGAYIGGYENEDVLYIIRASHDGSLIPGKFVPSEGVGFIPCDDIMFEKHEFEFLCGYNFIWMKTRYDRIPLGAVVGGYCADTHHTLYIGRASHNDQLIPGKVQPYHCSCNIPHYGEQEANKEYEILVDLRIDMETINRYYAPNPDLYSLINSFSVFEAIDDESQFYMESESEPEPEQEPEKEPEVTESSDSE